MRGVLSMDVLQLINQRIDSSRLPPSCNPWWITGSTWSPSETANGTWQDEWELHIALGGNTQLLNPAYKQTHPLNTRTTEPECDLGLAIQPPTYRRWGTEEHGKCLQRDAIRKNQTERPSTAQTTPLFLQNTARRKRDGETSPDQKEFKRRVSRPYMTYVYFNANDAPTVKSTPAFGETWIQVQLATEQPGSECAGSLMCGCFG